MEKINTLNTIIRVAIIPSGVILRVIIIFIKMMNDEDTHNYTKKIKNTILFGVVAELIYVINDLLNYYFKA